MRVSSKGQVTIPRDLRELVGIEPNSEVIFTIEDGKLIVAPKKDPSRQEERHRLDQFIATLKRLEGTGNLEINAETLMGMTRDR